MYWGMALILVGCGLAAYGLLPEKLASGPRDIEILAPPEDMPLSRAHALLLALLSVALIIDIMKPASLGFVTPGMRIEYGLDKAGVAWLPLFALAGTVIGSTVWGALADLYGRRSVILLSSVMFIGTSICRRHAVLRLESLHVPFDGRGGRRHASGRLRPARRNHADPPPRLEPGAGRRDRRGGRIFRRQRLLRPAAAPLRLENHVVPQPPHRPDTHRAQPPSAGVRRFLQQTGRGAEARRTLARFGAVARPAAGRRLFRPPDPLSREHMATARAWA